MSRPRPNANGRAQTQRIASGARANPYARPEPSTRRVSAGPSHAPPTSLSIRGTSGPTWIVVGNLLRGTTEADLHETFKQFGNIEAVRVFSEKDRSLTFEVAFTHASSAQGAIDKMHGVLADGRVLQVRKRDADAIPTAPKAHGVQQKANAGTTTTIPTGPRSMQKGALVSSKNGHANSNNNLGARILTAAELKTLAKKQEKAKKAAKPGQSQASASSLALAQRIGSLPLSMRLAAEADKAKSGGNAAQSSAAAAAGKKRKRAQAKAKAAKAKAATSGMQVDS